MARARLSSEPLQSVTFKLPTSEQEELRKQAGRLNMNVSEYIRHALQLAWTHEDPRQVGRTIELLRDATRVCEALNRALTPIRTEEPPTTTVVRVDEPAVEEVTTEDDAGFEGLGSLFG